MRCSAGEASGRASSEVVLSSPSGATSDCEFGGLCAACWTAGEVGRRVGRRAARRPVHVRNELVLGRVAELGVGSAVKLSRLRLSLSFRGALSLRGTHRLELHHRRRPGASFDGQQLGLRSSICRASLGEDRVVVVEKEL